MFKLLSSVYSKRLANYRTCAECSKSLYIPKLCSQVWGNHLTLKIILLRCCILTEFNASITPNVTGLSLKSEINFSIKGQYLTHGIYLQGHFFNLCNFLCNYFNLIQLLKSARTLYISGAQHV